MIKLLKCMCAVQKEFTNLMPPSDLSVIVRCLDDDLMGQCPPELIQVPGRRQFRRWTKTVRSPDNFEKTCFYKNRSGAVQFLKGSSGHWTAPGQSPDDDLTSFQMAQKLCVPCPIIPFF